MKKMRDLLTEARAAIARGGVIVFPTDTVHGMGAAYDNEEAQQRIFDLKGRDPRKPLVLMVDELKRVDGFLVVDRRARALAQRFWPGPLTIVLPLRTSAHLPAHLLGEGEPPGVAVRVPGEPALEVVRLCGGLLATTSANRSGDPPAVGHDDLDRKFLKRVDVVLPGDSLGEKPSTVLDLTGTTPAVLRRGAIQTSQLVPVLGSGITGPGGVPGGAR
jgi:L-threonylcarbamoyladenylate synthase